METIDLTPTWRTAVQIYAEVLSNPNADHKAKQEAKGELIRCGTALDRFIAKHKEQS
jgi:hypothetical protein